jgi:phosphoenolpyruvate phosphomutase
LVIIPTKYYTTPTAHFRELGISVVIWANHLLRAAIRAMQEAAGTIRRTQSLLGVEDRVVPLHEVFRLQRAGELEEAKRRYLPTQAWPCTAVVLAAARGEELGALAAERPKAMIRVGGEPILYKLVGQLRRQGVRDVVVVRGYRKETIAPELHNLTVVDNDDHATTGELSSLLQAVHHLHGDCVISRGDCLYRDHLLRDLLDGAGDIRILVDCALRSTYRVKALVTCSRPCAHDFLTPPTALLTEIATVATAGGAMGEWTGLLAATERGTQALRRKLEALATESAFERLTLPDLLQAVLPETPVSVVYTRGGWLAVDDFKDLAEAERYA